MNMLTVCQFRVRHSKPRQWTKSALNRYGLFKAAFADVPFEQWGVST